MTSMSEVPEFDRPTFNQLNMDDGIDFDVAGYDLT